MVAHFELKIKKKSSYIIDSFLLSALKSIENNVTLGITNMYYLAEVSQLGNCCWRTKCNASVCVCGGVPMRSRVCVRTRVGACVRSCVRCLQYDNTI